MSTRIIDEDSPKSIAALRELLAGFAHGDLRRVLQAFASLGYDTQQLRLGQNAEQVVASFKSAVWRVRCDFDPTAVTMSSTNIPDAITKLQSILDETAKATITVFNLLEHQEKTLKEAEAQLTELEQLAKDGDVSSETINLFISRQRSLHNNVRTLTTDLITSQEYQDLCGQRVQKVIKLLQALTLSLSDLLQQCSVTLPSAQETIPEGQERVDQSSADDILKDFGL
jgi:chemotaxis regulatin CheY-phosphate phosphatase CheZ